MRSTPKRSKSKASSVVSSAAYGSHPLGTERRISNITVLIANDQTLMREGLQTLLELSPGICVVGQAGDGEEAVALTRELRPDVVLMDVRMPVMDGVEATRRIRRELSDTQVIILSAFDDDEYIFEGLAAGAMGYLLKDVSSEELADAIRRVHQGQALLLPVRW